MKRTLKKKRSQRKTIKKGGGKLPQRQLNVLGRQLQKCCSAPITGYRRNGYCETIDEDHGTHTFCAIMTNEFLLQQQQLGNDLITPNPQSQFPGLKAGDKWCVCALRWKQAKDAGIAPKIILKATNKKTLEILNMSLDELKQYAY